MNKQDYTLDRENGTILLAAVMFLFILTVLGTSAVRTTMFELQIADNESQYKRALYAADSGISYALTFTESDINPPTPNSDASVSANDFTVPTGSAFELDYLSLVATDPTRVEIQSTAVAPAGTPAWKTAAVSLVAMIQLPTPLKGGIDPGGLAGDSMTY